ncbi:hypothetical protein EAS64_10490 [Trebonia kvetii]|uniref:Uncharacterized protein n=1 Tax=Trebonia kvetii TaxID=2480626 RepID=A0A6P2C1L2_9ACTN|nr:hypothetical protein [Trebonia kvetii]TVZ05040.1 hypothetical protein EAS64_10490 [Trebonia kvetii]
MAELGLEPALSLLVTVYILHIGRIIAEEMAATAGFPGFPDDPGKRLELTRCLENRNLDPLWSARLIEQLDRRVHAAADDAMADEAWSPEELLLATAILSRGERAEQQTREMSRVLSIVGTRAAHREDIEYWTPGIKGIAQITRLMIEAVIPTRIGTMQNLADPDSGLRLIATLGGALFLGHSIALLTRQDAALPRSPYAAFGERIAMQTNAMGQQRVRVPGPDEAERYRAGVERFARSGDSVFAIEHPFHFRVLLEVLSDENRRYPAEPVLNVEALRRILPPGISFWSHVVWSREQLPVVANRLRHPDRPRADAFIQHYAAFGRTPHTSSFTHLDYEVRSPVGDAFSTAPWPAAFEDYRGRKDVQNMPNSVCQAMRTIDQEKSAGRMWRGKPEESDLRWLGGQLVTWDGYGEPDGALADRIWHPEHWTGQAFPIAAMAEIRTGAWLLEALRLRLATAVSLLTQAGSERHQDQQRYDREAKADEELRCVLEIMVLFATGYLSGDDDGIPGLRMSLSRLRGSSWFTSLGPAMHERLDYLVSCLDELGGKLEAEVRMARDAVKRLPPQ